MAEKIDMSLDDIIKRDRIPGGRRGGRGGAPRSRGARAGRASSGGRAAGGRATGGRAVGGRGGNRNASPVKKVAAGGRQMKASGGVGNRRVSNLANKKASPRLNSLDKWQHDKFIGSEIKSASLMISNLDFGVSDQDIRELFSEFGTLKKAAVHYDSSGRSLGKADVVYVSAADAARAQKKYNGVPLDGRPMSITPLVTASAKASIASRIGKALKQVAAASSAPRARARQSGGGGGQQQTRRQTTTRGTRGGAGNRARGPRGGNASQRNPRSGPKKAVTAEELDADLDAYNTNKME